MEEQEKSVSVIEEILRSEGAFEETPEEPSAEVVEEETSQDDAEVPSDEESVPEVPVETPKAKSETELVKEELAQLKAMISEMAKVKAEQKSPTPEPEEDEILPDPVYDPDGYAKVIQTKILKGLPDLRAEIAKIREEAEKEAEVTAKVIDTIHKGLRANLGDDINAEQLLRDFGKAHDAEYLKSEVATSPGRTIDAVTAWVLMNEKRTSANKAVKETAKAVKTAKVSTGATAPRNDEANIDSPSSFMQELMAVASQS